MHYPKGNKYLDGQVVTMKALVIGGSRFIGLHLLQKLSERGVETTVVNRGNNNISYPSNCSHVKADRTNVEELKKAIGEKHFDWCFDVVAMKGDQTKQLIQLLDRRVEKFVHISTASVYELENPLTLPLHEEDLIGPTTEDEFWYAREKRLCEQHLFEAYRDDDFPMTIVRPTYVYGPDNYIYREGYFFDRILANKPVFVPKPGNAWFDLVHVDDVAELSIVVAEQPEATGQAFNASGGDMISGEGYTKLVGKIIGQEPTILHYSPEDLQEVEWPDKKQLFPYSGSGMMGLSMTKAAHELGFVPQYRLKDGLRHTYEWYRQKKQTELPEWSDEDKLANHLQS